MRRITNRQAPHFNVLELLLVIGVLRLLVVLMRLACALPNFPIWRARGCQMLGRNRYQGHRADHAIFVEAARRR